MKKSARGWLGFGMTVAVLGLVVYHLARSPEWRHLDWGRLWRPLMRARPVFLLGAVAATLFTYVVRAYRWRFFMDPIKRASLWVLFVGQVLGFCSIYLIGRLGEVLRPAYIARKENVSVSSMLGVLLLERLYDAGFVILLFVLAVFFAPVHFVAAGGERIFTAQHGRSRISLLHGSMADAATWLLARPHFLAATILLAMGLVVSILVLLRLRTEKLATVLARVFRFLPARARQSLRGVFYSFAEGLEAIRNWRDLLAGLISTAVLWCINTSVVWFAFQSMGGELSHLSWVSAGLVLFWAAFGLLFQLPGVGGGYQLGSFLALRRIFAVQADVAAGAAILLWIVIMVPCVVLGLALLIYEGLSFKKLRAIAQEARATMAEKA